MILRRLSGDIYCTCPSVPIVNPVAEHREELGVRLSETVCTDAVKASNFVRAYDRDCIRTPPSKKV